MTASEELYLGIMSGTSLDGIDVALVDFSGDKPKLHASHYRPYRAELRQALLDLHQPAEGELHQASILSNELAREYALACTATLESAGLPPERVRAIGCHGQTVRHRPESGYTLQLGNAALLTELSNITVISDFRSRDIAAGGQGAPLVPAFHDQQLRHPSMHRVIVNIGGISNLTDLPPGQPVSGFDCGPGNLLMDAWVMHHHNRPYDQDGAWATSGRPIPALLKRMLAEPFLLAPPPKSSGRDLFNLGWLQKHLSGDEAPADVQATLLALSSQAIADAIGQYCKGTQEIYLCGGGARNQALLGQLCAALPDCLIQPTDVLGIEAEWMEAMAFAWLARQTERGLSGNLPAVTGARHPCILGAVYQA